MKKIIAVVLAGGCGQRMASMCRHRAKPILPFGGGMRVIDFTLSNCLNSGIKNMLVLVDYRRGGVAEYIADWRRANSAEKGMKILEPEEKGFDGTADAVRRNLDVIKEYAPDAVLVLAADHIYRMDYREMIESHLRSQADVSVAVKQVPFGQASRFGVVTVDGVGRITGFIEKPAEPRGNLVSMGVYIFNTRTLLKYLEKERYDDFGHDLIPSIIGSERVMAYKYDGYWQDIGTIGSYYIANMDLLRNPPKIGLNGNWPILTGGPLVRTAPVVNSINIYNSMCGPDCVIEGRVKNSILAGNVHVKPHAVVMNSILLSNAAVAEYSLIDHCILDEDVRVEKFCYLGRPHLYNSSDITVFDRGTVISQYDSILFNYRKSAFMGFDYITNGGARLKVGAR
jgi:glucose-1-phosphate adenylyltransferase